MCDKKGFDFQELTGKFESLKKPEPKWKKAWWYRQLASLLATVGEKMSRKNGR